MDWDNDGKNDLIAGDTEGKVWLFLNTGTKKNPELAEGKQVEADGKPIVGKRNTYRSENGQYVLDKVIPGNHELAEIYSKLHMADWDGDGLKDLLIGHDHTIIFYKNLGIPTEPLFQAPELIEPPGVKFPTRPSPYVVDWDGDGKKDLLVGTEKSEAYLYRNTGTNARPKLARRKKLDLRPAGGNAGYRWRLDVTDWNNDGKQDILVGNFYSKGGDAGGNIWLFLGK